MQSITILGGGLAGLVSAIHAAEPDGAVDLYEAGRRVGERGRRTAPPYIATPSRRGLPR